jgi:hypothetical protein
MRAERRRTASLTWHEQDPLCNDCHRDKHHDDFKNDVIFQEGRRRAQERKSQQRQAKGDAAAADAEPSSVATAELAADVQRS